MEKYLKYKKKYVDLKYELNGKIMYGGNGMLTGINFEGGKIIEHILKCKNCIAYANCQIAMDAPYHGRIADESVRSKGRSESQFPGYDEDMLKNELVIVFDTIRNKYQGLHIIIQIARGRSGLLMFDEVIRPILEDKLNFSPEHYTIIYGYRSANYYKCDDIDKDFIFVNIGMYAVLTNPHNVRVGELCNPVKTWEIKDYSPDTQLFDFNPDHFQEFYDDANVLNNIDGIKPIHLFGIGDNMKFVTPDVYSCGSIINLLNTIKQ